MTDQPSGPATSSGRRGGGDKRRRPRQQRSGNAPLVDLATLTTPPEIVVLNQFLSSEKDAERERQRIKQAESAKNKAANRLKELRESNASKEEIAEADAAYRESLDHLAKVKAGEVPSKSDPKGEADGADASAGDAQGGTEGSATEDSPAGADDGAPSEEEPAAGESPVEEAAAGESPAEATADDESPAEEPAAEEAAPTPAEAADEAPSGGTGASAEGQAEDAQTEG